MQTAFAFHRDVPAGREKAERLFFCVFPDRPTARRVAALGRQLLLENGLDEPPIATERLHVSLHHVGDVRRLRSKTVFAADRAARAVCLAPFDVTWHVARSLAGQPSRSGPAKRPLVLIGEGAGFPQLHARLGEVMARNGLRPNPHFMPHMTMAYAVRQVAPRPIEPIRFTVDAFALVHSRRWLGRYEVLGRWSLGGREG